MEKKGAAVLVAELKGLMPMLSEQQAFVVRDALMQRDDVLSCLMSIRSYASSYEQFSVAGFLDHLPARPGSETPSVHDSRVRQSIDEGNAIERQHEADNDVCERLDDATFDATAKAIIGNMDADIAAMMLKRKSHRQSQWIRSLVAEYARVNGLVPALEGVR